MAVKVVKDALEIYGGYGYMKEYPIERIYREVAVAPVGGGTSSIHRLIHCQPAVEGVWPTGGIICPADFLRAELDPENPGGTRA